MDIQINTKELPNVDLLVPVHALRPLRYRIQYDVRILDPKGGVIATIPKGFISDGASVPLFFHRIAPPMGMYLMAALAHDYYCELANDSGDYEERKHGDDNFHQWLRWCGVSQLRAKPMSAMVKMYGKGLKLTGKLK